MIELGLSRMSQLMRCTPQKWKSIHIAGTNGKGTICAYLSAMLRASGVHCGRFTSPHLIDRWDGITIDDIAVEKPTFLEAENLILSRNTVNEIKATEFEILTATAFEIFSQKKIEIGVVEVGLGGRLDSTNIIKKKAVTVISKIGLDHQSWLGNSIEEIALEKAGIMRAGVPCVLDRSNSVQVRNVIEDYAQKVGTHVILSSTDSPLFKELAHLELEPHQIENLSCAYTAFRLGYSSPDPPIDRLLPAIKNVYWPGRLQTINIRSVSERQEDVLLDGAHNQQSAKVLASYVNRRLRHKGYPVTWVIAATQGKDAQSILQSLLQSGDRIGAVKFFPVNRMPWIEPMEPEELLHLAHLRGISASNSFNAGSDLASVLRWAVAISNNGPIVITGSLYLVSDILRLLRDAELPGKTREK